MLDTIKNKLRRSRSINPTAIAVVGFMVAFFAGPMAIGASQNEDLKDSDITNAVESDMLLDNAVSSHLVDIVTDEGIVTLSGTVSNLLAHDRAIAIAKSVKGVRAVVDEMDVKPVERADADIRNDVKAALVADPAADSYEVDVSVRNGVATLTGTVDSWQEKYLSSTVAKSVRGVRKVKNQIEIDYDLNRLASEIKADVKRRLQTDVRVDDMLIDVSVDGSTVELSGAVGSAAEKTQAIRDARVAGVVSVDTSKLTVEWWARDDMKRTTPKHFSDDEIKQAVRDAFYYDPRVLSFNPTIKVNAGEVTLTGEVSNMAAKKAAEETAMNTVGVWRVRNYLHVRPETIPSNLTLAKRVEDAFKRDPYVERYGIAITALNGEVYLYGTVDTLFEKEHAENVASSVTGVITVDNNLEVRGRVADKDDLELRRDVQSELFWSPFVDVDDVTVSVDDGTVTLAGTVDTWLERRTAADNAREAGAENVHNLLVVKSTSVSVR